MHITVIGGNGFIGQHFVEGTLDLGHKVTVVGRKPMVAQPGQRFDYLAGGIRQLVLHEALLQSSDVICHFASSTVPATANNDPVADISTNLVETVELLETLKRFPGKRIIYLSSGGAVYGNPQQVPISETHPLNPIGSYGINKMAIEKYIMMYSDLYGFTSTIIRPSNPYGPGQSGKAQFGAISTFLAKAMLGEPIKVFGGGAIIRDFIYITDLCDLLLKVLTSKKSDVYNAGYGQGHSISDIINLVEVVTERSIPKEHLPHRPFDPKVIVLDNTKVSRAFDWIPKVDIGLGIELSYKAMQQQSLLRDESLFE
jgi:UDP-glucose 4-epimerase